MPEKSKIFTYPILVLIFITGINIFLQSLPLTNVLHYEFSAINGVLQSFFGGLLAVYFLKIHSIRNELHLNILKSNYRYLLIFTFSQFLLAFVTNIFFQICPISQGVLFYFIITIPSYLIGIILGAFAYKISTKYSYIIFPIIWLLILLAPIPELYSNPQIYFFNPIIGLFPGTIYDENIVISSTLILYRFANISFFILVFLLYNNFKIFALNNKVISILIVLIIAFSFSLLKPTLGFSTDIIRIKKELKGMVETDHFIIFYPKTLSESNIVNLIYNHEYAFSQLTKELNDKPIGKIYSFVFEDGAQKGRLFGSENADVAKPWLNHIYLNYSNYRSSLQHELAHIFSANYGNTIFRIADNFNPALIEGFATSLANNYDDNDIHFMAALAYHCDYKVSLNSLFTGFNFFNQSSSLSYIYAGSFIKYLKEIYGTAEIKELYGELNFRKIFDKDISDLEIEYYEFLKNYMTHYNKNSADFYFGRKPILKRFCARYVANQLKKGSEFLLNNEYQNAEHIYSKIYSVSDSYGALIGKIKSLVKLKKETEALNFLKMEIKKFEGTSYFFNLEFVIGDLFQKNSEVQNSDSVYSKLMEQAPREDYINTAYFKRLILKISDSSKVNFTELENSQKVDIIKEKLNKFKSPELVAIYIDLLSNPDYLKTITYLNDLGEQVHSGYSLFEISKFAADNNDYKYASYCISKALELNITKNKKIIYSEYLNRYNWIRNFGNKYLPNNLKENEF